MGIRTRSMVVAWTVITCLFATVTSVAAATAPAGASPELASGAAYHQVEPLSHQPSRVSATQTISPKIVDVPCNSNQYWGVYYRGGGIACFAQNGTVSAYPEWYAVTQISSGNNSGVIYYYSNCNWDKNEGSGTVLQYYIGSESIWRADICMTAFTITGR